MLGYLMIEQDQQFRAGDGIVKKGVEETIRSVGRLGKDGMRETEPGNFRDNDRKIKSG